jgi:hypothetical protein
MKHKTIDGGKIFLGAMEKAGIEIPKSKEEVMKLFDEIEEGMKKKK